MKSLPLALAALAGAVICALPASAGKPEPFVFANASVAVQRSLILEKYNDWPLPDTGRIVNGVGCAWDVRDRLIFSASGDLAPGASDSTALCVVSDYNPIWHCVYGHCAFWGADSLAYGVLVKAPSPDLRVIVCYAAQDRCFSPSAVQVARKSWTYSLCVQAVYAPNDPVLELMPNSGGEAYPELRAYGVRGNVVLSVESSAPRVIRDVRAEWGFAGAQIPGPGCLDSEWQHEEYPFKWTSS